MVRFDDNDAWIFWAIPSSREGTDLRGLIGAADAVNHAVPFREQIVRSINRGLGAGLVEVDRGRFRFTPECREEVGKANASSKVWLKQWDAIASYLTSRDWPVVTKRRYRLAEAEYAAVIEQYLA